MYELLLTLQNEFGFLIISNEFQIIKTFKNIVKNQPLEDTLLL